MQATITHIHHNCFALAVNGGPTFLFDPPAGKHMPRRGAEALQAAVRGADVVLVVSHSHSDHFDKHILDKLGEAKSVAAVVSDDVVDMYPEALPPERLAGLLVVEPEETYRWQGMEIETLESNDLGVAFLVRAAGITFYFGGDLAQWDWPEAPEAQQRFAREFFRKAVEHVAAQGPVDIAFSNVDPRLPSLAGGPLFMQVVRPKVFVPMHLFSRTGMLRDFEAKYGVEGIEIFAYKRAGDSL